MNLKLNKALVFEVKTRGQDPEEKIVGVDLILIAEVKPKVLAEFDANLPAVLCDENGAPRIPEMGRFKWRTEYENGEMNIGDIEVLGVGLRNITITPKPEGIYEVRLMARSTPNKKVTGELAFLIKQEVGVSFKKMAQKPLLAGDDEEDEKDQGDGKKKGGEQQKIVGLLDAEERERAGASTKH